MGATPAEWPAQEAKARFSELINASQAKGPQVVTRRGVAQAVVVPIAQWRAMNGQRETLKDLLLADHPRATLALPERGHASRRPIPDL
jgi:prevent-host-death family protein